ncbi:MAG: cytochrome c biogenesis protein CcsA [Bacteroidota bacterium]
MIHTFVGDLGHLFVIVAFVTSAISTFCFFKSSVSDEIRKKGWIVNGRIFFYVHAASVLGVVVALYYIIQNHYFEYHYAWSHSSLNLPAEYMISCFWEGQEGSFLLWLFWHALLGIVLINTNKFWEGPVMTIFGLVQVFLASMILGVVIPGIEFKIGSSPFILLRDALDAPIFKMQPDFVPKDGTGLNPLLQNYWMVIHPPTLFLGFATTLIPFAYCIAGLWQKKYKEWIRPALPWALFSAAVLGLGILMGGYWAYETLNFGGYWNWDPVENAVYVPWLVLVASIHTMITFKNSNTALKSSIVLVISMFVLILYSTFLTRSGILGESSVHSFTDLGLSGQLLLYLGVFTIGAIVLAYFRWKEIPSSEKEASFYSREFWIFIGVTTLCLMAFHVIIITSFPVFNTIVELFGGTSNLAPPADQIEAYSRVQIWGAVLVAILSGTGQFFWWKKIDSQKLKNELLTPLIITALISAVVITSTGITNISYITLLVTGLYSFIANLKIFIPLVKSSPKLSGGAVAHIGVAMMLVGIMYSAGKSKVVSLNNTGLLISKEATADFNKENLLLFLNEPRTMAGYTLNYRGQYLETQSSQLVRRKDVTFTGDPFTVVARNEILNKQDTLFTPGDTIKIFPENTYYEVEYYNENERPFSLFPRAQVNPEMGGLLASPDIRRKLTKDLYTHVSSIPNPEEEIEWSEMEELTVSPKDTFFVNDYVAVVEDLIRIYDMEGVDLNETDVAVKAKIRILGETDNYVSEPYFLIVDGKPGVIHDDILDLGIRLTFLNIFPETGQFLLGLRTTQKDWVVLKAMEKPMINVLWIGTLVLMIGFGIAIYRRYTEFVKMRDKSME